MTKTPGTHPSEDKSQQPRQEETPTPTERSSIANEDHTTVREKLSSEQRGPSKPDNDNTTKPGL